MIADIWDAPNPWAFGEDDKERPADDPAPRSTCDGRHCGGHAHE